jgi:hypothetical protein
MEISGDQLLTNNGKQDRLLTASQLLRQKLESGRQEISQAERLKFMSIEIREMINDARIYGVDVSELGIPSVLEDNSYQDIKNIYHNLSNKMHYVYRGL